jgi:hypothetical protein
MSQTITAVCRGFHASVLLASWCPLPQGIAADWRDRAVKRNISSSSARADGASKHASRVARPIEQRMVSLEIVDDKSSWVFSRPIIAWGKTHIDAAPFSPSRF